MFERGMVVVKEKINRSEFIINAQTEELFLDFKQAVSDGKSMRTLHPNDRRNLGKAISAFGSRDRRFGGLKNIRGTVTTDK